MIPGDERISQAMHKLEPPATDTSDAPELFGRVVAGVRRRRRRRASGAAVAGVAAAVAVIAIVPALGGRTSGPARTPTAEQPVVSNVTTPDSIGIPTPSSISNSSPVSSAAGRFCDPAWLVACAAQPSPPSFSVAAGSCAPGFSLLAQIGETKPHVISPGSNLLPVNVGDSVTFLASGQCATDVALYPGGDNVFGALGPGARFGAGEGGGETLTVTTTGNENLDLKTQTCADADSSCTPGTSLATITVSATPLTPRISAADGSALPSPLPTDTKGCPTAEAASLAGDISGTAGEQAAAVTAAVAAVPGLYGTTAAKGFQVTDVRAATPADAYGGIAYSKCGPGLGASSMVVQLHLPAMEPSADLSQGVLFLANFPGSGWRVWFQYH